MAQPAPTKKVPPPAGKGGDSKPDPRGRDGWRRWVLGWIVAPGVVLGGIFGGGVYIGANHPDGGVVRAVLWVVNLF